MGSKLAGIKIVLERLLKELEDPQSQQMLRYMLMALSALQLFINFV